MKASNLWVILSFMFLGLFLITFSLSVSVSGLMLGSFFASLVIALVCAVEETRPKLEDIDYTPKKISKANFLEKYVDLREVKKQEDVHEKFKKNKSIKDMLKRIESETKKAIGRYTY